MVAGKLDVHFSSLDPNWRTPEDVFTWWHRRYFFDVDAAATFDSRLVSAFFSPEGIDALTVRWGNYGNRFWINPPYGRTEKACGPGCERRTCLRRRHHLTKDKPGIERFVRKAATEAWADRLLVVALLPARTDTDWWHDYVMQAESIYFVNGRISFVGATGKREPAPFPNAFVVWNTQPQIPKLHSWDRAKELRAT